MAGLTTQQALDLKAQGLSNEQIDRTARTTGEIIKEIEPEIMDNSISLSDETVYTVLAGMKNVVENGSAAEVFASPEFSAVFGYSGDEEEAE